MARPPEGQNSEDVHGLKNKENSGNGKPKI